MPLLVTPADAAKPTALHVKLNYAVCGNLCVPAEADLRVPLDGSGGGQAAIEKAQKRVPRQMALGAHSGGGLAITGVHREAAQPHDRIVVDVAAPAQTPVQLFVEGPTPDWALPQPQSSAGDGSTLRHFSFDLDGLPADAKADGATLTFTAVSPADAIEVPAHLD
jgi:DsbC/DsbD-like thiol-disulfide interchange protein